MLKERIADSVPDQWGEADAFTRAAPVPVPVPAGAASLPSDVEEELEDLREQVEELKKKNAELEKAVSAISAWHAVWACGFGSIHMHACMYVCAGISVVWVRRGSLHAALIVTCQQPRAPNMHGCDGRG